MTLTSQKITIGRGVHTIVESGTSSEQDAPRWYFSYCAPNFLHKGVQDLQVQHKKHRGTGKDTDCHIQQQRWLQIENFHVSNFYSKPRSTLVEWNQVSTLSSMLIVRERL